MTDTQKCATSVLPTGERAYKADHQVVSGQSIQWSQSIAALKNANGEMGKAIYVKDHFKYATGFYMYLHVTSIFMQ